MMKIKTPIYMDYHATTPVDHRVFEAMTPYFMQDFGNAASLDHVYGANASATVERARKKIADLINAEPEEIISQMARDDLEKLRKHRDQNIWAAKNLK